MRKILNCNRDWLFFKDVENVKTKRKGGERVHLPHTWNAKDGQDGGNDYFRGSCLYVKYISRSQLPEGEEYYLEINGANSSAEVYVNGTWLARHDGGYSTWRVRFTEQVQEENEIAIVVNNAPNERVYPQVADFTFYGGLYRSVRILAVGKSHFDLEYYGGSGLKITPTLEGTRAKIEIETFVTNLQKDDTISYTLYDREGEIVTKIDRTGMRAWCELDDPHLWQGRDDPYLYTCKAALRRGNEILDEVALRFGIRRFEIDPEKGFLLNGREYPLRGVSRHQDRLGIGNALLEQHHEEDIRLILELGATSVRLAHYQHDQYFYDLCDENGLVVWAEIPYISKNMPLGRENAISQMTELIVQNYHHPSIVVWGLSNEITMNGTKDPDMIKTHEILNDLVHGMDKTRLTTMACISMCDKNEPYVQIPDVVAYNHYFGWYGGDTSMNGPWFDEFHAQFPDKPIGVSEYGCEGLNWHTSAPMQGDYTEEYQAFYHEELIKQLFTRKYLWATYVWNMFDFGADARAEGGENGINHKGLVTMDRLYKKDAFYAYKAWLSPEPFVHICGKRYVDRVEDRTKVTVYSNQQEVELFLNGRSIGKKQSNCRFFYFEVPNEGESELVAVAGSCKDSSKIKKVDRPNEAYICKETGVVLNWFDIEMPKDRYSLNDKIETILQSEEGRKWLTDLYARLGNKTGKSEHAGFAVTEDTLRMMSGFTLLRLLQLMGVMNVRFSKEELLTMNAQLNRIVKSSSR